MGRITTSTGLVTGFPIEDTVNQLIAISAKPRDALQVRIDKITVQQNYYTAISTALLKVQLTSIKLINANLFDTRSAFSADQSLLRVTTSGSPAVGSYQFTPLQQARSQQLLSTGFASADEPLGAGQLKLRFGGAIDPAANLAVLNGGRGVAAGSVRITDRSGRAATIDLRTAQSVDDVLRLINTNDEISVRAEARGDRIVLLDQTGQSASNLKVQEVGGGTTAADLGLAGIDVAASEALGQDVMYLGNDTLLSSLNDGNGVRFDAKLADLRVNFSDGSSPLDIDFTTASVEGTKAMATTSAAAGLDGQLVFTALKAGSAFSDVQIRFVNDSSIIKGSETATYDATAKTLTFKIREGATTATDIVASFGRSPSAAGAFTVRLAEGGNGNGFISSTDGAVTTGPPATATTVGTLSPNARLLFTATREGENYAGVTIRFVDDPEISVGSETVTYDDSDFQNKTLTFKIRAGSTTANDIVQALQNNSQVSQLFKAETAPGSNGTGLIDVADEVVTMGGQIIEPIPAQTARTVGDLINVLNAADPTRLSAQISADGNSIELVDLTGGTDPFTVEDINGSRTAFDLGFNKDAAGQTIAGRRLIAGLNSVLLTSLNGGAGLGELGILELTDRSGASTNVDLSLATTIDEVISAINASGLGLKAAVNASRDGISIADTTGLTASNLVIASGDATDTAEKLGLAIDAAMTSSSSGSLRLQVINENTRLANLNGGAGVNNGAFTIFSTGSASGKIDLSAGNIKTIGELVAAINALQIGVEARINEAGDGMELVDMVGGTGALRVEDQTGTAARDLHLTGASVEREINGVTRKVIDGATAFVIEIAPSDTLTDLVEELNAQGGAFSAALFNSGSGTTPYKLAISSQRSGSAGNLIVDTSELGFALQETVRGVDAIVQFGGAAGGTIASSRTNDFANILPGLNLQVVGASSKPVEVTVSSSATGAVSAIKELVAAYNTVRELIAEATKFTPASETETSVTTGPLFGDSSVLRVDSDLARLFSQRIFQAGSIQSLATVGISLERDGTLSFDEAKFNAELLANPNGVKDFFTTKQTGFIDRLRTSIDQLSAGENAILVKRLEALSRTIESHSSKITDWNVRLTRQREQLLLKFYRMEEAIGKMQNDLSAITSMQQSALAIMAASAQRR